MKYTLLLILNFLSINSFSQICDLEIINDNLTRKTSIFSPRIDLGDISFSFNGGTAAGQYHKLFLFTNEKVCLKESNQIYLLFEDNEQFSRENQSSFNCDGFGLLIINNAKIRNLFKEKKLIAIQINTMSKIFRVDVEDEQAELIRKHYNCLEDRKSYKDKIQYKY